MKVLAPDLAAGQSGNLLYYIMPFVDGESLRQRLARETELSVAEAVRLVREIADALSHAHRQGIVHRDIKPENVLLSNRHAVVADFGIAKAIEAGQTSGRAGGPGLTSVGFTLGTPAYMAPEQAVADPAMDHRADLYSLGVVAYEMLAERELRVLDRPQEAIAELRRHHDRGTAFWLLPDLGAAYDDAGQPDSAVAVYERFLSTPWLRRFELDGWHRPRILFRLGELYEQRGDRARAADYYSQFAELWRGADPDLQPRVTEARRRLAALTAEPGRQ